MSSFNKNTTDVVLFNRLLCAVILVVCPWFAGCQSTPSGGTPIQPPPLGHVVDAANRLQENNAEAAKFIVYTHEFELNKPLRRATNPWQRATDEYHDIDTREVRGIRLNEYGMDHLERIAQLLRYDEDRSRFVVVERSETSKRWNTEFQYPVHRNRELDEERRLVVVHALELMGIDRADRLVIVAPAFAAGQNSNEAAQAYRSSVNGNQSGGQQGGGGTGIGSNGGF